MTHHVGLSEALAYAVRAAETASSELRAIASRGQLTEEVKEEDWVGHHAIVTAGDIRAQEVILEILGEAFPQALFITEEKSEHPRIMKEDELTTRLGEELVFLVDPVDGSSQFQRGLYEYAVSIGIMERGVHTNGVICAPAVRGGMLMQGGRCLNGSVFLSDGMCHDATNQLVKVRTREKRESVIYMGPDIPFLDGFSEFVRAFSKQVRTTIIVGSCALGLALVAAGKVDALIEPVQCPWDWGAGYPLVKAAGGKVQFYHYRFGVPKPLKELDIGSYIPSERNTAFIAGSPAIVDWLFGLLQETWVRQ